MTWAAADLIEKLWATGDALANAMRSGGDTGWDRAIDAWDALSKPSTETDNTEMH